LIQRHFGIKVNLKSSPAFLYASGIFIFTTSKAVLLLLFAIPIAEKATIPYKIGIISAFEQLQLIL
jgi:hypothetical protein